MTSNCPPPKPQSNNVFDGTAYFAARHLPAHTKVCLRQHPFITGSVASANGLERTVVLDPLVSDDDVPPVPSWLPHTHSAFPAEPVRSRVFSVRDLQIDR
jgi:hypothetical protein